MGDGRQHIHTGEEPAQPARACFGWVTIPRLQRHREQRSWRRSALLLDLGRLLRQNSPRNDYLWLVNCPSAGVSGSPNSRDLI
jgi:hypothetical protein